MATCEATAGRISGFTYLGVLFAVFCLGMGLATAGTVWSVAAQRDREKQLLFVGHGFRDAIRSYYLHGPAGIHQYPRSLEALLEDRRGPVVQRHLRRIYFDPMTGARDWQRITTADGAIIGINSASGKRPIKQRNFAAADELFADAACYCDWRFIYLPQLTNAE